MLVKIRCFLRLYQNFLTRLLLLDLQLNQCRLLEIKLDQLLLHNLPVYQQSRGMVMVLR